MANKAGVITINLNAGTAKFMADMDSSGAKIRDFANKASAAGHGTRASMIEASAGVRALEGDFNRNIRAVERFLSSTLGLGPVFKTLFPIIGAIATADILLQLGTKIYDFFKSVRDAGEKSAAAFRTLNGPVKLANDQLQVSNDRLQNEIAKLEGHHQNTLKLALDEARVAADKLAESLLKDLGALNKVLAEQNVGKWRQLFGEAGTTDIKEMLGGKSGFGGITGDVGRLTDQYNESMAKATTLKERDAAQTEYNTRLLRLYQAALDDVNKKLAQPPPIDIAKTIIGTALGSGPSVAIADNAIRREMLQKMAENLRQEMRGIPLQATNQALTDKKDALTASAANAQQDRPFLDRMKMLGAEIAAVQAKLNAIGKPESAQIIAKAFGEAEKAITETNKALERHHTHLTKAQEAQIRTAYETKVGTEALAQWREKMAASASSTTEHIRSQELLAAAIGKGYAATRAANVETRIMQELGQHFGDAAFMQQKQADIVRMRGDFERDYDAQHAERSAQAIDKLNDQIELEKALAAVQMQGVEAVREATLAVKLRQMADQGATKEQLSAEKELFEAQRANVAATDISKINERIAATRRLTAAMLGGAEGERKAALENKYASMERAGSTPAVIAQERKADEAEHQQKITAEAQKTGIAYIDQLNKLNNQIALLKEIEAAGRGTLATEISLRNAENERLKTLSELSLKMGSARDGVRAFFLEMQEDGKRAATAVYEALNSAVDRISENMAKLLTGQKASWAQAFKDIGEQMLQSTIKSGMQKGLGQLGKALGLDKFGIDLGQGKPDGTKSNPFWVKLADSGLTPALPGGLQIPTSIPGGKIFGSGDQGGGIFSFLGGLFGGGGGAGAGSIESVTSSIDFGGGLASGGGVEPGTAYMVGEHGPEMFVPRSQGAVIPHGGGDTHYNIDARGADLGAHNRIQRGIEASHRLAVATAVQATHERSRRVPGK